MFIKTQTRANHIGCGVHRAASQLYLQVKSPTPQATRGLRFRRPDWPEQSWAAVQGHRSGENPARWEILRHLPPATPSKQTVKHHAALSWKDVPALTKDGAMAPTRIVAINGALSPFKGAASRLFPAMAKLLFVNPLTNRFFVWRAGQTGAVQRLIEGMGSHVPARSLAIYQRLFLASAHIAGALAMMANWDLDAIEETLPRLGPRLVHLVGSNDRTIPPDEAFRIAKRVPGSTVELLRGPGHLMHEDDPQAVADMIVKAVADVRAGVR